MSNVLGPPPGITAPPQLIGLDGPDGVPTGLDVESLLAYCTSRLNSLDALIQSRFAEQQTRNTDLKAASKTVADLNTFANGVTKGAGPYVPDHIRMGNSLIDDYNSTANPELKAKIASFYRDVTGKEIGSQDLDANGKVAKPASLDTNHIDGMNQEEWQGKIGPLKSMQDGLTKDNELSMIQLQALVSQRQLAIQLTTQLMQTMHEGAKGVLSNIRG